MRADPVVALAYGYGSQNIGNAFFQLGGREMLRRAVGHDRVIPVGDVPAHWTLHRKAAGNPANWWSSVERVEADYVVFLGPSLGAHSIEAFDDVFAALARRGVEPVLASTGFMSYSLQEAQAARSLIDRHRLRIVLTRDRATYHTLGTRATYDGIDAAFFLPWAHDPARLDTAPYAVVGFERFLEPESRIRAVLRGGEWSDAGDSRSTRWFDAAAARSQAVSYALHRLRPARTVAEIDGLEIVRPVHRSNPPDVGRFFKDRNAVVADEPYTYLALFAGAAVVLTDRVHAAVAALSYGVPALLAHATPRRALLERVGVEFPMSVPVRLDPDRLEKERVAQMEVLRETLLAR